MRSKYYDVVFLGGAIGGLLSAISLLKKGIKVLILNTNDYFYPFKNGGSFSSPWLFFGGFTLRNLLKSLGFHPLEINRLRAVDPSLQVVLPGIRFDLHSDEKKLLCELKCEFPDIWGEANNFFTKLTGYQDLYPKIFMSGIKFPPENFIEKYKLKKFTKKLSPLAAMESSSLDGLLGGMSKNKDFLLLFRGIVNAISDLSAKDYSLPYLSQVVNTVRFEGYEFDKGIGSFHELLLEKVKERGGIILNEGAIDEISIVGRYVDSLKLSGCSVDKLVLSYMVINGNPKSILKFIPSQRKNILLRRRFSKASVKYLKYTFYLKLRSIVYPEGMRERVVMISDRESELSGENFLYLHKVDEGKDEKGEGWIILGVSSRIKPEMLVKPDFVKKFSENCIENISSIIPFLDEHILNVETPPLKKIDELDKELRSYFVYESDETSYFGMTALPYTSNIKNLLIVGQSIYPGLGFDGEVQSGLRVSRHISDAFKVKRP